MCIRDSVASAPKRGSRLCGSLSRATTRVPDVSESPMQPLEHSAHAEKSATMQPIWLTLFRALWYDPRRRRGSGGAEVSMRLVRGLLATFFLLFLFVTPTRADTFPRPASLEPNITFWRSVFADYSRLQVVVHDTWYLDKVYSVLDFRSYDYLGPIALDQLIKDDTAAEVARLRAIFAKLDEAGPKPTGLTPDEQRIFDMYRDDPTPTRFRDAADPK